MKRLVIGLLAMIALLFIAWGGVGYGVSQYNQGSKDGFQQGKSYANTEEFNRGYDRAYGELYPYLQEDVVIPPKSSIPTPDSPLFLR